VYYYTPLLIAGTVGKHKKTKMAEQVLRTVTPLIHHISAPGL